MKRQNPVIALDMGKSLALQTASVRYVTSTRHTYNHLVFHDGIRGAVYHRYQPFPYN
ncbi:hypothetical protein HHJ76_02440 [Mobiluncus mulieris]|uniref:hypothetical protein n=1 Tax=Mobiluncus mulieris TaxID=2052 RepID=UPI0014701EEC|nr:hypothetical protein [Mobiluncus mulieris]NMW62204.1 hypothetical protein [Mobiluncus mulieris]